MRIPWPITVVAVLVTLGLCVIAVIMAQVQNVPSGPAPSWGHFIAGNALRVLLPTLIVGLIAWIIERNIRRSRPAA
jgi:hypothetical protein